MNIHEYLQMQLLYNFLYVVQTNINPAIKTTKVEANNLIILIPQLTPVLGDWGSCFLE